MEQLFRVIRYLLRLVPPDVSVVPYYVQPILETLMISFVGTSLAFMTAVALSFPANREMFGGMTYVTARAALAVMRATPVLVLGIICVAALGFGPTAGIVGVWFHTSGVLGKYFSECLESMDRDIVDASYIDGCTKWRSYISVMIPMSANSILSYLLYYYEANFRSATFLGIVGAGGIGLHLTTAVGMFQYGRISTIIIMIISTALVIDFTSRLIRSKFL